VIAVAAVKMNFERTRTIYSAIVFILLQGLITTQQSSSWTSLKNGVDEKYNVPSGGEDAAHHLTASVGDHPRLISKRESPMIDTKKENGEGEILTKDNKKMSNSSSLPSPTSSAKPVVMKHTPKMKSLVIPDRSPPNLTETQMKELKDATVILEEQDDRSAARPGQGNFDEKAMQRAIVVIGGIALIIAAYVGVKFFLLKKRKVVKRYGRIESSEIDLLDEVQDDEESEEEEELFDINQQRRS